MNVRTIIARLSKGSILGPVKALISGLSHPGIMQHTTDPLIVIESLRIVGDDHQGIRRVRSSHATHIAAFENSPNVLIIYALSYFEMWVKHFPSITFPDVPLWNRNKLGFKCSKWNINTAPFTVSTLRRNMLPDFRHRYLCQQFVLI